LPDPAPAAGFLQTHSQGCHIDRLFQQRRFGEARWDAAAEYPRGACVQSTMRPAVSVLKMA
jgi:hypothetical protein